MKNSIYKCLTIDFAAASTTSHTKQHFFLLHAGLVWIITKNNYFKEVVSPIPPRIHAAREFSAIFQLGFIYHQLGVSSLLGYVITAASGQGDSLKKEK